MKRPTLLYAAFSATKQTLEICNELYGRGHFSNNSTNAFRHALWNMQICVKVSKRAKNDLKAVSFAKKFTDLYEKVTKNEILDELMDLHNNEVGRSYFLSEKVKNDAEMITFLLKLVENAQIIEEIEDFEKFGHQLVFISE